MADAVLNPLRALVGYQLRRASTSSMDDLSTRLSEIGLRPITASVLVIIGANPLIQPSALGRELGIQRANVTPLIASLEKDGLVARRPFNGRTHGLELTPAGLATHLKAHQIMLKLDEDIMRNLRAPDRVHLAHLLSIIIDSDSSPDRHYIGGSKAPGKDRDA